MRLRHVVDQFHDQHGLADTGAAEQADLAALRIGREQIDHLDAGHENRGFGGLIGIGRRLLMDSANGFRFDRPGLIDRLADHIDDAAQQAGADRHRNRRAGIGHFLSAHQTFRRVHRHGADRRFAEMLGDFEHQPVALVAGFQRVQDLRQMTLELHVNDGADYLRDFSSFACHRGPLQKRLKRLGAGDDLDQLFGNHRLARAVVSKRLFANHVAGVAGGVVHCRHLRAVE